MRLARIAALFAAALIASSGSFAATPRGDDPRAPPMVLPHGPLQAQVWVCFVPAQQCDVSIASAIRQAKQSIRVQAYGFTAPSILNALLDAKARGVDVQVILDKSNDPFDRSSRRESDPNRPRIGGASFTAAANIPTWIDHSVAIAHNKVIVIDGRVVIGGSYNFTASAERRNAENVTFIDSPEVARLYLVNWDARRAVARRYSPPVAIGPYVPRDFASGTANRK